MQFSIIFFLVFLSYSFGFLSAQEYVLPNYKPAEHKWKAEWITPSDGIDTINSWINYRKEFVIRTLPHSPAIAHIAVDSKYWLWINGKIIVREGQVKRGPTPYDTYYDQIDIAPYLTKGKNSIAILVWYFGKDSFSHKSSGKSGLIFDLQCRELNLQSDSSWKSWRNPAFGHTEPPHPNYRLSESNKHYDARNGDFEFTKAGFDDENKPNAIALGSPPIAPWNKLVKNPLPQWKDFGLKNYENIFDFPFISNGDTILCELPYNAQITPFFEIETQEGAKIDIRTDHYNGGGPPNIRTEYITREGKQAFEDFGWINGHTVKYHFPKGVKILSLKYRETGYDTEFSGSFTCDDHFYNRLWNKSLRTLYVTMRDTYMDCPDRERAQWWGDVVLQSGESFYALDRKSDALTKKGILELMNWQREDNTIFSPVPAGNWDKELPGQMLASVGFYGFYNYYLHTGDLETIRKVYSSVKDYLSVWKLKENGTVEIRQGGWFWGDWGENRDIPLLINTQYYLAKKGLLKMAEALGEDDDIKVIQREMENFKKSFNANFWKGSHYRSNEYKGETDDRSHGLAVVSGLAEKDKFPAIYDVLQAEMHASPYMEKYVVEALFQMGYAEFALKRLKERFSTMVNHPGITTLWEGWGIGKEGFGGGTTNHAWSGGGLTLLSQYVAGIMPTSPGYKTFNIKPQLGCLKEITAKVPSIKGDINVVIKRKEKECYMDVNVPMNSEALVFVEKDYRNVILNEKIVVSDKSILDKNIQEKEAYYILRLAKGKYKIKAY